MRRRERAASQVDGGVDIGVGAAEHDARRVRQLELTVVRRLDGLLQGGYRGRFVGPGSEPGEGRAYQIGERLRACVAADEFAIDRVKSVRVTASVGIATLESPQDTPESMFKRADNALYTAKRRGRNRVVSDAA